MVKIHAQSKEILSKPTMPDVKLTNFGENRLEPPFLNRLLSFFEHSDPIAFSIEPSSDFLKKTFLVVLPTKKIEKIEKIGKIMIFLEILSLSTPRLLVEADH